MKFEDFKVEERLHGDKKAELQLPVVLPAVAGDYSASFGFLNKKGVQTGQELTVSFKVLE